MDSKTLIVGLLALVIGVGGGYAFASGKTAPTPVNNTTATHETNTGDMMANLQSKTGAEFEMAFIDEMTTHHQSAIDMARLVPQKTSRPELLKLSNDIITAQTSEIQMMGQWKTSWFGR